MIILTRGNTLKLVLGASPGAEAQYYVAYTNSADGSLGLTTGVSNGTTEVTMLDPNNYSILHPRTITIHNADSGAIVVSVMISATVLIKRSIAAGETLMFSGNRWSKV